MLPPSRMSHNFNLCFHSMFDVQRSMLDVHLYEIIVVDGETN